MQINKTDCRPNFGVLKISPEARKNMLGRMPEEEFANFTDKFNKSPIYINIYDFGRKLGAGIRFRQSNITVKEGFLSALFNRNPKDFIQKVKEDVNFLEETFRLPVTRL